MKLIKWLLLAVFTVIMAGCEDSKDRTLYFVGDSIVARWDLRESFPSYVCYNDGLSGAGIDYVERLAGKYEGKEVVVMIGTNNCNSMQSPDAREEFAERYVEAIVGLNARKVYLYSVLPRDFAGDYDDCNSAIFHFNELVEALVGGISSIVYIQVYNQFMLDDKPNPQYYNDGLHLSPYGYEILKSALDHKL